MTNPATLSSADAQHIMRAIAALQMTPPQDPGAVAGHCQTILRLCELRDAIAAQQRTEQAEAGRRQVAINWIRANPTEAADEAVKSKQEASNAEPTP